MPLRNLWRACLAGRPTSIGAAGTFPGGSAGFREKEEESIFFCDKCGRHHLRRAIRQLLREGGWRRAHCGSSASAAGPVSDGTRSAAHSDSGELGWPPEFCGVVEVCWIFVAANVALPDGLGMGGQYGNWPFNFLPVGLPIGGTYWRYSASAHSILAWDGLSARPWARPLLGGWFPLSCPGEHPPSGRRSAFTHRGAAAPSIPARNTNGFPAHISAENIDKVAEC